jgi:predicted RNA-binding Zn-ribbon protein involved in translation (DUF1610 family)
MRVHRKEKPMSIEKKTIEFNCPQCGDKKVKIDADVDTVRKRVKTWDCDSWDDCGITAKDVPGGADVHLKTLCTSENTWKALIAFD